MQRSQACAEGPRTVSPPQGQGHRFRFIWGGASEGQQSSLAAAHMPEGKFTAIRIILKQAEFVSQSGRTVDCLVWVTGMSSETIKFICPYKPLAGGPNH